MDGLAAVVIGIVLVNQLGPSGRARSRFAAAPGVATVITLALANSATALVRAWWLQPADLDMLTLPCLVLITTLSAWLVTPCLGRVAPAWQQVLRASADRQLLNATALGIALLVLRPADSLAGAALAGAGTGLVFTALLAALAPLRERVAAADVPAPLRGSAIALVTGGLLAIALSGVTGLVYR